jgi:cytidyltransferase-like protein
MWETLVYFDLFDYPLTREELFKFSHKKGLSFTNVKVSPYRNYYFLPGRESLVTLRRQRFHFSQLKWQKLNRFKWIFKLIPWIKLVAVTGALSMNNASKNDDLDLMIITVKNRLWLTRLLLIILLFPFLRRHPPIGSDPEGNKSPIGSDPNVNKFCLNLWLDESALKLDQKNLYIAHELAQLKPIFNKDETYQKLINVNLWIKKYLPNWDIKGRSLTGDPAEGRVGTAKPEGATLMDKLDFLSFRFQYSYMKSKITREKVGSHFAFFHPRPTGEIILEKYKQILKGLTFYKRSDLKTRQGRSLTGISGCNFQGQTLKVKSEIRSDLIGIKILVTGCFDVLHSEHIKFLKAAKKLGGKLLVGVETDTRVRQLKGPGRPVNSLQIRLKNLQQLRIADEVFALPKQFNDLNHFTNFINQIRPNILAVSASTPNLLVKRKILKACGGCVVIILPHNPKVSTTKMIKSKS